MSVSRPVGGPMGAGAGPGAAPAVAAPMAVAHRDRSQFRGRWVQLASKADIKGLPVEMVLKGERRGAAGIYCPQDGKIYSEAMTHIYALGSQWEQVVLKGLATRRVGQGQWEELPHLVKLTKRIVGIWIEPIQSMDVNKRQFGYYNLDDSKIYAWAELHEKVSKTYTPGSDEEVIISLPGMSSVASS